MSILNLGSLNLKYTLDMEEIRSDLIRFIDYSNADIVGLNEFGSEWRDELLWSNRLIGWSWYREDGRVPGNNPIMWRTSEFDFLDSEVLKLSKTPWYRAGGAKVIEHGTYVTLRHCVSTRTVHVLCVHTAPGIQGPQGDKVPARRVSAVEVFKAIDKWARKLPKNDLVVVLGDMNWDAAVDSRYAPEQNMPHLISQFEACGLNDGAGTHHKRDIDYIFIRRNTDFHEHRSAGIVKGLKTDHNGAFSKTRVSR